ncbi:hypothetical protein SBA4_2640004 [Candidatus Sulfopaludibacter sp. SbA4]|nr:hypothetical protein SBA4_2640004 [Candidatus Sulfopaludibacter sp. SbA4]
MAAGEWSFGGRHARGTEANAAEGLRSGGRQVDAQRARGGQSIRHDAFAAGFIDGRHGAIGEQHLKSAPAGGDGGGQPGRAAPDYENVSGTGEKIHCGTLREASADMRVSSWR